MTLEEKALSEALQSIDVDVAADLAARARAGGRRRLARRRSLTAVGAVAIGAAAAPITIAVRSAGPSGSATFKVGSSPSATDPGLYATPPAPGSECNSGFGAKIAASSHPDLLLLPPGDQQIRYAFVRDLSLRCASPHVALTAVQEQGDSLGAGLLVEGPNAPTPAEDGRQGPNIDFFGDTGHQPIDGQTATEYTLPNAPRTDAYWTEPDGGQWHAVVRDMSQHDAIALLNQLAFDGHTGTATLPDAAGGGWTVTTPAEDRPADETGWFTAQWVDQQGHLVDLTATQTPDRTMQDAIAGGGPESVVTLRGTRGVLSPSGGNGGGDYGLVWQESKDVQVSLALTGGSAAEIEQIAESLVVTSPDDPRISKD
ncbi:MAG: hypothetical protein ACTHK4_11595 [Mycobacteriales bacterium]